MYRKIIHIKPIVPRYHATVKPNVRIYVLCHTKERFAAAPAIYGKYYWAVPILMKYQDCTCENAFWKQLLEIKDQWINCEMVGTISYSTFKKVRLSTIDNIIRNKRKWDSGYYHFADTAYMFDNDHPHINTIKKDICSALHIKMPTNAYYNYWMCSPDKMLQFIPWVTEILMPTVLAHPLAMTDARYGFHNMSAAQCMAKWGVPYYPHIPFVLERLNKAFFI